MAGTPKEHLKLGAAFWFSLGVTAFVGGILAFLIYETWALLVRRSPEEVSNCQPDHDRDRKRPTRERPDARADNVGDRFVTGEQRRETAPATRRR